LASYCAENETRLYNYGSAHLSVIDCLPERTMIGTSYCTPSYDWYKLLYTFVWLVQVTVHLRMIGTSYCTPSYDWYKLLYTFVWLVQVTVHLRMIGTSYCTPSYDWYKLLYTFSNQTQGQAH